MKIKTFADSTGISLARIYRALPEVLKRTEGLMAKGGRHGGTELTSEQQRLLKEMLPLKKTEQEPPYEARRQAWVETWVSAYFETINVKRKQTVLAVIGALVCAKDRAWLME